MEYFINDGLLNEVVKFLEICQASFYKQKINIEDYYLLTKVKLGFIEELLGRDGRILFIDKELRKRINKVYLNDYFIFSINKEAVGK